MLEILIISLVVVCLVFAVVRILIKVMKNRAERQCRNERWQREDAEYRARAREKRLEWNRKVNAAKRYLVGKDWRDSAGKTEFVQELFGEGVPQYLWYECDKLNDEDFQRVIDFFFDGKCGFGDIERHYRLRIRNAKRFAVELLGGKLSLDQVGYCDGWDTIDEDGFPTGTVLFSADGFYPSAVVVP